VGPLSGDVLRIVLAAAVLAVLGAALAVLVLNARARGRRSDDQQYRMLAESVPNLIWTADAAGTVDYCNGRFAEYTGEPADRLTAGWDRIVHPLDAAAVATAWRTAVGAGTPYRSEARLRRYDGGYRWHVMLAVPMRDERKAVVKWFGSCTDIQDQKDAERILTVLAEVTQALASSLDPHEIAHTLAAVVAPAEAAYCEVQLYGADDERLVQVAAAGDPAAFGPEDAERVAWTRRAGATMLTRELAVVPVKVSDQVLGWLVCCDVVDDVRALVPELAARLGGAIANAKAYEREHRVATTFQRAALGLDLPDVPGLRFSALYQAAHAEASVGGDWYDAFRLPDGRVVISVGDVAGSGLDAAVTMGSVRQSIRTAVLINPDPVAVLDAVDRIVRAMGNDRFVTAFAAVFDPVCAELTFANAGHPPPLVRRPDGTVVELTLGDLPLGLRQRGPAEAATMSVEPGSLIVGFTDGLTEFDRDPVAGEALLRRAVERSTADDAAREIFDAVCAGKPARDDVALLTVAFDAALTDVDGPRRAQQWTLDVTDAVRAAEIRHEVVRRLGEAGLAAVELAAAELVFAELIGNVYRHARGRADVMLDVSGAAPVLHVLDSGGGFEFRPRLPADLLSERGRGLFLVNAFADEFSMERRRTGGSHARAVLVGRTHVRSAATMARTAL
jgi:PAS domain S-box-containing protein